MQLITSSISSALSFGLHRTDVKFARDIASSGVIFTAVPVLTAVQVNLGSP
ncbi:hypothetical protein [Amycolatopsis sp. cmx-8-4]|uniref:hypothetical protein n=1 Tax=Amycolatopsis sp. cmx-8-4 TaxID=2790947 RepID=UPI0039795761